MNKLKRLTGIFLSTLLIAAVFSSGFSALAEGEEKIPGDLNGDGAVTVAEAREILKMAAYIVLPDIENGDMNADGDITLIDARLALKKAMGLDFIPEKSGDNIATNDPENEYIVFIADEYKIDKAALAAIYTEPASNNNYVLQFKKKSLLGSEYSRKPADLEKVYQIDLEKNVAIATKSGIGCQGCTLTESILIFNLVQTLIMPQHPNTFEIEEKQS